MIFKCIDGEQRASRDVLRFMSDWFSSQLDSMDRFQNEYVFTCPFSKQCVKTFLDTMHNIQAESLSLNILLEMIKYIMHLGKSM